MAGTVGMKIGALIDQVGIHPAAWLDPSTPLGGELMLSHFVDIARTAERGKLDFFFMADSVSTRDGNVEAITRNPSHMSHLEPLTLLSALAATTERLGLVATASTSYSEPYNLARQFASLDHLSAGRAGWNAVTTAHKGAALNFGLDAQEDHARRYDRANEFVKIVIGLWDSWDDGALVRDRERGIFFEDERLHRLNHKGEFYSVRGPLNIGRAPQGRPVLVSAGGSVPGRELAARTSDVVFSVDRDMGQAKAFYDDQKDRLAKYGRAPKDLKIMTSLNAYVGRTDAEAQERFEELQSRVHPAVGLEILSVDLGIDLRGLPVDKPIPEHMLPYTSNATKSYFDMMVAAMREENLSIRDLYLRCSASRGGLNAVVGSPLTVADRMQEWFEAGAADGFMVRVPYLPEGLTTFVDLVIPELQRRGLFRQDYEGRTLRDHLGLARPASVFELPAYSESASATGGSL